MNCHACGAELAVGASACDSCGATLTAPTLAAAPTELDTGTVFHRRYEILRPLGRGGMGMVYEARDRTLDEVVAIKILRPDFAQDPRMAHRFKSEIKLARKVRHRNVCAIHDFGEDASGVLFISMERIEGSDLKRQLRARGPLPSEQAYDVAIQVSEGLQAVHELGIVHRDLKSPNVMLDAQGVAHLMDFGIAKRQGAEGTITTEGQIVGTPDYMSPEQAQGKKVDARSDVYALGILTYEIFTGQVPFKGDTPISTILKQLHEPPPLDGASGLPPALRPVLARALAKKPEDRFGSAGEFGLALRRARATPDGAVPETELLSVTADTRPDPRPHGARRLWLAAPAVAAVVAIGYWVGGLGGQGKGAQPAPPSTTLSPPGAGGAATGAVPIVSPTATPTPSPPPTPPPTPTPTPAPEIRTTPAPTPTPQLRRSATPSPARSSTPAPTPPPTTLPAAPGELQVIVRPWGEVVVNGRRVGTTPFPPLELAPGEYTIRVIHPKYEAIERRVEVASRKSQRLVIDFVQEGVAKR